MTDEFPLFPRFPYDVRRLIWILSIPLRDVKLGTYGTSDGFFYNTPPLKPPAALTVCRESRSAAFSVCRFIEMQRDRHNWANSASVWFDTCVRAAYLPSDVISLRTLLAMRCEAKAIAVLSPPKHDADKVYRMLLAERKRSSLIAGIDTIYYALSGVVYGGGGSDTSGVPRDPPYQGSDVCVMTLDDGRLLGVLEAAHNDARSRAGGGVDHYHRSAACLFNRLHDYWALHERAREIRAEHAEAHTVLAGPDDDDDDDDDESDRRRRRPLPRLVPAVLFGRTKETLHHGRGAKHLLNERAAGLVSKPSDAFDWSAPPGPHRDALDERWLYYATQPFHCDAYCRDIPGLERAVLVDPALPIPLLESLELATTRPRWQEPVFRN